VERVSRIERVIQLYRDVTGREPGAALVRKWRTYLGAFADVE